MRKNIFKLRGPLLGAFGAMVFMASPALSSEIEGNWTTASGETAAISSCGSSFCITLKTGDYIGKQIGKLSPDGQNFSGTITDPADDKEYSGSATINEGTMHLKGCTMVVFCKTQIWQKQ